MPDFLASPEAIMYRNSMMMRACLTAQPTRAHTILRELIRRGFALAPIITNNFDGLPSVLGLDECYIRRYDEDIPFVPIHEETKALLVIGSHADRRRVQARCRQRGLQIIFLDPEEFEDNGAILEYPIEGAREGDLVRKAGATVGLMELAEELGLHVD